MKLVELLAPAKDYAAAAAAVDYGADAVYIGGARFGARQAAGNSAEEIARVVEYAHRFGVRVHATLNTLVWDDELEAAERQARSLIDAGVDALIVQDMALRRMDLPVELHASTQVSNRTPEGARFLGEAGFARVILERNLTLEEISELQERQTQILREKQMSQLRNLQMQINPHFLGNCFNAVYNASLTGDFEQVLALTTYLNRYFRFMAQVENDFVLLEEELRFTDDFLSIQKLRFGDAFSYTISVPAFLRQARIPPSVIKSFAENAVKYARNMSREAKIDIRASMQNREGEPYLWLEVLDNGPGFSDEVLQVLQQKAQPFFDGRVHIGIANVRQRLELLYAGKAEVHLENRPDGGTHVSVILPLNYGTEQPEKEETL